ncbi:winged helix-turn-helix domain-containing protein [Micromonospora sp. NPDC049836]|uniref:winged helix-turn-helix domain-containing protein n=1 Tax=Micromonospora sp. NPDC049836 TaxID=3364274 RepID=UPI0037B757B2
MSVVAIAPRRPGRPDRAAPGRPRTASTLTITVDLGVAGPLTPSLARLVDLLDELAASGEGVFRATDPAVRPVRDPRPATAPPAPEAPDDPGTVRILAGTRVVRQDGREVPLTRIEYDLLLFLAEHPRRVFTRRQLLASVWGYEHAVARTVDVHVRRLRAKLGLRTPLVTTVYGVGYRLADEARIVVDPGR